MGDTSKLVEIDHVREKLIEFVHDARMNALWHNAPNQSEYMTDMLIANGVTIPVRCKDCKHFIQEEHGCNHHGYFFPVHVMDNDFCSYGERKDNDCC